MRPEIPDLRVLSAIRVKRVRMEIRARLALLVKLDQRVLMDIPGLRASLEISV